MKKSHTRTAKKAVDKSSTQRLLKNGEHITNGTQKTARTHDASCTPEAARVHDASRAPDASALPDASAAHVSSCTHDASRASDASALFDASATHVSSCTYDASRAPDAARVQEASRAPEASSTIKTLVELFCVFFKIGIVTFGGGLAMLPILERELIDKRGWTTKERMLDYFTIGQSTPGIIAVNVATFLGYTRAGVLGGIVATTGVVTPSLLIISFLALFLSNFNTIARVQKALLGINIAVAALLTKVVYKFKNVVFRSVFTFLTAAVSFTAVVVFKVNTAYLIIFALVLSFACYFIKNAFAHQSAKEHANKNTNGGDE